MEALTVFNGSRTSCVSSLSSSPISKANGSLSYSNKLNLQTQHLSSFHNPSSLFSLSITKLRSKNNNNNNKKPHIFLPHLVASLEDVDQTYIMIKPDGVQRGLVGEIISRFEKKGFKLTGLKLFKCPKDLAEEHYKDLNAKPFFPKLTEYITSGPVVCMAWEGVGVVASARKLIGVTNPLQAEPGTIRGDLAVQTGRNVIHGSDSPENGKREIALWFKEGELCEWTPAQAPWLRE
ncbi:hypothetical protein AQUCO_12300014v1 [Aquilegia coerulea]|uniref:Nucleoside diphosphate kinase n=1 Tax=Aquilegia coerulea TaxID=218851 RepID=A0A2G5C1L8_AQUCA|nr:hypothetical protein AQUCO_12300014v1 [Aquilegia coerulea]